MTPDQSATARRRRIGGAAMVGAVLLIGAVATGGATTAVQRGHQRLAIQSMNTYDDEVGKALSNEIDRYGQALNDVAAAVGTHPDLTAAQFAGVISGLRPERLPGATAITFVVPAYDEQIPGVQAMWRARGAAGLSLYPTGAGARHEYLVFGRSFDGLPVTPGRDLAQIDESADALRIAEETGAFTMSRAHVLYGDHAYAPSEQQMSFMLAVPVLGAVDRNGNRSLRGWITMAVHGGDFLAGTLREQAHGAIQVRLDDPAGAVIASVADGVRATGTGLTRSATLDVGQHTWRLTLWPTTGLLSATDRLVGRFTLILGIAVTLLLATLVGVLAGAGRRAMNERDEYVLELQRDKLELERLAFHDILTGLANRAMFYDRVAQALKTHVRGGARFAVFFLDLDGFKQVNDRYGHRAGDIVLCQVAERLLACLRDGDTVARFGGDEFAVITERLVTVGEVHRTAARIVEAIRQPIDVGGREAVVTASVGVALNRPGYTADDILRTADEAMYTAKTTGKGRHVLASV